MPQILEDATDVLLVLLYAPGKAGEPGEAVSGITRLQKLLFLLQNDDSLPELIEDAKAYDYVAYKMGPYSKTLRQQLDELQAAGIIATDRLEFYVSHDSDDMDDPDAYFDDTASSKRRVESFRYRLSDNLGMEIGRDLWRGIPKKTQKELAEFKAFFNSIPLRQLLVYVYRRYPEFTTESKIKRQLGLT
ncbi:MAG: hypothetical protein ICCCNLDF_03196 [Planctomycetes bacterium]|nr:hypothetical protein [Planctomycetota bacterium]